MTHFPDNCMRCGTSIKAGGSASTMSFFNTDIICMDCKDKETKHPDYERAREAEIAACKRGNYNFPGIGKPRDL